MKKWTWFLSAFVWMVMLVVLSGMGGCGQPVTDVITEDEAMVIGDRYEQARNEVNLDILNEIYHPDVVVHDCSQPEDILGLDALKNQYTVSHTALPDLRITIDEMIVKGDKIVWIWTFSGTNTGSFGELPATGKKIQFAGVAIDRIVDGKIAEEWVYFNLLDLYQQLGFKVVPAETKSEKKS